MLFSFKCGRMDWNSESGMLTAVVGIGELRVEMCGDLLEMSWTSGKGEKEEWIVITGDAEMEGVREDVVVIKFASSGEKLFFWAQEKRIYIVAEFNRCLESTTALDLNSILSNINIPSNQQNNIVDLTKVITPQIVHQLSLNPTFRQQLYSLLPPLTDKNDVKQVISSPQFQEALRDLSVALNSQHGMSLAASLGIPVEGFGVAHFLEAIKKKFHHQ